MSAASNGSSSIDKNRVAGSLYGLLVGDAIGMPVHWFYSPQEMRADYGEINGMTAPKKTHAESVVQGMSYAGTVDILHDKAQYYAGNQTTEEGKEEQVHYHGSLEKGQNTVNACIARLAMRYIGESNAGHKDLYDPDEFQERFVEYMKTKPDPTNDKGQLKNHNDIYLDIYIRQFFEMVSKGTKLRDCAQYQRDVRIHHRALDAVVMSIPIIAAYANEPEAWVVGRAVEHHMLTHRSVTVTATVSVLVPLLLSLWKGAELKPALDAAMEKLRPPKITGRELRDSYVDGGGPYNIPKQEKWKQHMELRNESTKDFIHSLVATVQDDEDALGWGDKENSRLAVACDCEQAFTGVLYLAYKYGTDDPKKAFLQNARLGGHTTSRGSVLGAILGAAHGAEALPFLDDLCAKDTIDSEISALVATI
eukprot:scaffold2533_cov137-Cylindrotheca_fusiformis.AAC.11